MRRKPGTLLPLEADILTVGLQLRRNDSPQFHGFQLAKELADDVGARQLTAHGTLYKALGRLSEAGLLASVWEDPDTAAAEGRPRRRLYEVTVAGQRALAAWQAQQPAAQPQTRLGWSRHDRRRPRLRAGHVLVVDLHPPPALPHSPGPQSRTHLRPMGTTRRRPADPSPGTGRGGRHPAPHGRRHPRRPQ